MDQPPQTPPPDPPPAEPTKPTEPVESTHDEQGRFRPGVVQPGANIFKPGQSGNPNGGSQKQRLTSALKRAMDKKEGLDDALINTALSRALKGDFRFFKEIYDRIEGTVAQRLAGHDGGPLAPGLSQQQLNLVMTDPKVGELAQDLANRLCPEPPEAAQPDEAGGDDKDDDAPEPPKQ